MRLTLCFAAFLICLPAAPTAVASEAVFDKPLAELMSPETFKASGLNRLSTSELNTLQQWLEGHANQRSARLTEAAVKAEVKRQAEEQGVILFDTPTEKRFDSRIPGRFEGITGRGQLITLENGQTWRVTSTSSRRMILRSPEVSLRRNTMGGYFMTIYGLGEDVRVERVK